MYLAILDWSKTPPTTCCYTKTFPVSTLKPTTHRPEYTACLLDLHAAPQPHATHRNIAAARPFSADKRQSPQPTRLPSAIHRTQKSSMPRLEAQTHIRLPALRERLLERQNLSSQVSNHIPYPILTPTSARLTTAVLVGKYACKKFFRPFHSKSVVNSLCVSSTLPNPPYAF